MKVLFVSWDGPQVTYLEGLFLPIFSALQAHGISFHVIQFTWADRARVQQTRQAYEAAGVGYQSVRVHRFPKAISAILTAVWGGIRIRRAVRRHAIDVIMPRSIMPALAVLMTRGIRGLPVVFDADGLPIDERVDFEGQSPTSLRHRVMRDIEVQVMHRAKAVLVRTAKAAAILEARAGSGASNEKFHVVGNGRDSRQFSAFDPAHRSRVRARLGIADDVPLLVYAGSIGLQYAPAAMMQLFANVLRRRPDARMLVLSTSATVFKEWAVRFGIPEASMVGLSVRSDEVPEYLACADLGLALRTPTFSMQAVAPIKLGEYLLCGLPVVVSTVVGDSNVIAGHAAFLMESIDVEALELAAEWFVESVLPDREGFRERSVFLGNRHFSLDKSVEGYLLALQALGQEGLQLASPAVGQAGKTSTTQPVERPESAAAPALPGLRVSSRRAVRSMAPQPLD